MATLYDVASALVNFLLAPRLPSIQMPPPLPMPLPLGALPGGIAMIVLAAVLWDNRIIPRWIVRTEGGFPLLLPWFGALTAIMGVAYLLNVSWMMPMGLGGVLTAPFIILLTWYWWESNVVPKLIPLILLPLGILTLVGGLFAWQEWSITFLPASVVNLIVVLVVVAIVFVIALVNTIMMIWFERKVLGRMMDRRGAMHVGPAGLLQNFADGMKLFTKEVAAPKSADKLGFNLAPAVYIITSIILLAGIPISDSLYVARSELIVLFLLAVFSLAPFFIFLAGWSSNNKYTLIGGVRSAAQLIAYEIPLILSVVAVLIFAGTLTLFTGDAANPGLIEQQQEPLFGMAEFKGWVSNWFIVPMILAFLVFSVAMLAEVERIPFDLPEAEAELVEGWTTEYSSMKFAFIMLSDYIRGFVAAALAVHLFFGGFVGPAPPGWEFVLYPFWFFVKVYLLFMFFIWIRASLPRIRTDQLLNFGWKGLMPLSLIAVLASVFYVIGPTLGWGLYAYGAMIALGFFFLLRPRPKGKPSKSRRPVGA
jgi:NADH-quinone oxidoreductase subunit H